VSGVRGTLEFATEAYNYNTLCDDDPRNLVLLCTSQGVAVQQDGEGAKRLLHHAVDESKRIHRYWLEAERSDHKVGGQQKETKEERDDALARGKATASVIGTKAMGTRFNVLMTIQVPLQQKKKPQPVVLLCGGSWGDDDYSEESSCDGAWGGAPSAPMASAPKMLKCASSAPRNRMRSCSAKAMPSRGTANAARVSRGSEFDIWPGLSVEAPERNSSEHVTVTVVIYNTVADGVPGEADVMAAIDDLENLYAQCGASGKLADSTFDFMKEKLTGQDVQNISAKVCTQPYEVPPQPVMDHDVFPAPQ